MVIKCNECGQDVVFVDSRKEGIIQCDAELKIGYTLTGRPMEVYLKHECKGRASNEVSENQTEKGRIWVGPCVDTGR